MLDRVLLDANAILNAAFVPQSWSRLVVAKLVEQKKALFVGSRSLGEAVTVARTMAGDLGKRRDPAVDIDQFIRHVGAIEVHPSGDLIEAVIPAHDHHVVGEAITGAATILTSDPQLWIACRAAGRRAVVPLEALRFLDGMSLATTAFGVAPGRDRGSVFARVHPGNWAGQKDVGQFTVADFPGRLWFHYCTRRRAWVAEMPEVGRVTLAAEIAPNVMQTVAISWEVGKHLRLRVATIDAPADIRMRRPLGSDITEAATIGIHASHEHSWCGAINVCVLNDRPVGAKLWAKMRAPSPLTPNPYDDDRLRRAIAALMH